MCVPVADGSAGYHTSTVRRLVPSDDTTVIVSCPTLYGPALDGGTIAARVLIDPCVEVDVDGAAPVLPAPADEHATDTARMTITVAMNRDLDRCELKSRTRRNETRC